ncbi:MAG: Crp/Fnr family transcriptional regulator [Gammaproteobacteria bacterium]
MSDLYDRILLLKKSAFFGQVKTEDLKVAAQSLEEENYFTGDRVFDVDEYGDCMYIIQQGRVGISLEKNSQLKNLNFVAELGEGECFGEMNLLDDLPRSASAHIIKDSVLLSLEKSRLKGLIINYPELSLGMLKGLSIRLREANLRNIGKDNAGCKK